MNFEELEAAAMALPLMERAALAHILLESLEHNVPGAALGNPPPEADGAGAGAADTRAPDL